MKILGGIIRKRNMQRPRLKMGNIFRNEFVCKLRHRRNMTARNAKMCNVLRNLNICSNKKKLTGRVWLCIIYSAAHTRNML